MVDQISDKDICPERSAGAKDLSRPSGYVSSVHDLRQPWLSPLIRQPISATALFFSD